MKAVLRREGLPLALLLAWLLLLLLPPLLRGEVLGGDDLQNEMAPLRGWLEREWLARGELPGWNRFLFCGYPNLSVHRSEVLYPPDVIFRWLPAAAAYSWSAAGHLIFAALGVYICGRAMALRPAGALVAGLLFTCSFPYLGRFFAGHVTQIRCASYLPWVLLCLEGLVRGGAWRVLPPLAALLALQALAWAPDLLLYALYFYAAYLLARLRPLLLPRRATGRLALFAAAVGLALVPLLPTMVPLWSNRADLVRARQFPAPVFNRAGWHTGLIMLTPGILGDPRLNTFWLPAVLPSGLLPTDEAGKIHVPNLERSPYWEETIFCGVTGLLLALVGSGRRDRYQRSWLILLALTVMVALGDRTPVYRWLTFMPGLGWFRCPSRVLLISALMLALLAGRGLDRLRHSRRPGGPGRRWPMALVPALLVLGFFLLAYPATAAGLLLPAYPLIQPGAVRESGFWLAVTIAIFGLLWHRARHYSSRWRLGLVILVGGELWLYCLPFVTWTAPPPVPWWDELLPRRSPPHRINRVAPPNCPTRMLDYGRETCDGRDPLRIRWYETWAESLNPIPDPTARAVKPYISDILMQSYDAGAYRLMDIGYLILPHPAPDDVARLVARRMVPGPEYLYELREQTERARLLSLDGARDLPGPVTWREYDHDRMVLTASCTEPAQLIIGTTYHRGWSATVDGRSADLVPYRDTFLSLSLAPGARRVELAYRLPGSWFPWWLARAWLWLLLAGALAVFVCARGRAIMLYWRRP